jgi:hypothetical protein
MKNKTIKSVLIGLSLMGVAHQADAEIFTWSFEAVSSGNVSAFVDFDDATSIFTIRDNALNADLAPNAGINGIAFNLDGPFPTGSTFATSNIGNFDASTTNPTLPTGFTVGFIGQSNKSVDEVNDGESTTINFGSINVADIDGWR